MKNSLFRFLSFLIIVLSFSACTNLNEDISEKVEKAVQYSEYTVEHYLQSEDKESYNIVSADTKKYKGKTGTLTNAKPIDYEGFLPMAFEQQKIKADGTTTIKIYYNNAFSIIYDLDGGVNSEENPAWYTEEDLPVVLQTPEKEGYKFFAWISEDNEIVSEITSYSKEAVKLSALWYKEGQAYYLVNHNLQDLKHFQKYNLKEKEYLIGNVNSLTTAEKKTYTGFENPTINQQKVRDDHSTVVDINYDRSEYLIHFIVTFEDRKNCYRFNLLGRYQEKVWFSENILDDEFDGEYIVDTIQPSLPETFTEDITCNIVLKSKYKYYQEFDENDGIILPFVCRDFRNSKESGSGDGYITQKDAAKYGSPFVAGKGHPDFEPAKDKGAVMTGMVESELGADHLPVFKQSPYDTTKASYDMWYRDYPGINKTYSRELVLKKVNLNNKIYEFESESFFPVDNEGYGKTPSYEHNYSFTDTMFFYFQYDGKGQIEVSGDDDIWVFVNGKLAIDLGGCHVKETATLSLEGRDKSDTVDGKTYSYKYNAKFDIVEGQLVEVRIFHAERRATSSSFKLKLNVLDVYQRREQ